VTVHDIATRLVVLRHLRDRIDQARTASNIDLLEAGEVGDRTTAKLDGETIGSVTLTRGRETAQVIDEAALTAWVTDHYPSEIEHVTKVRPAFVAVLLKTVKENGGWIDKVTGEFHHVDGVDIRVGDPYVSVKPADGSAEVVAKAWQERRIEIDS
jgi:hypothetical protein